MTIQTLSVGSKPEIEITNVGGDLNVQVASGNDIQVRSDDSPRVEQDGDEVTLSCGGDLVLSIPRGASLTISDVGGDLKVENLDGNLELSSVGGDVTLLNVTGEVSIEGAIGGELQTENVRKISMDTPRSYGGVDVSAKVQRKVDEAMRRAERKMREAEQKMREAHSKHLEFRMNRSGHPVPPRPPSPPRWDVGFNPSDAEKTNPVSDEERMTILKMLQDKKITSEEADKLLAALEGGE